MHTQNIRNTIPRRGRNLIHIDVRRVGCQDRPRLGNAGQGGEDFPLHGQIFKHSLDHQIGRRQFFNIRYRFQGGQSGIPLGFFQATFGDLILIVLVDARTACIQGLLCPLQQHDLIARIQQGNCNATAHRSGPDDRNGFDRPRWGFRVNIGNLGRSAFCKEHMAQRGCFLGGDAGLENFPLLFGAFREGEQGSLDTIQTSQGGTHAFRAFRCLLAQCLKEPGRGCFHWTGRNRDRRTRLCHFVCKGQGSGQDFPGHDTIHNAQLQGLFRTDRLTGNDHIRCGGYASQTRQALCAAGPWGNTQIDLWLSDHTALA